MNKKALIAMSGGVDSSVSALMMLEQGYECTGVTMKLFANEDIGVSKANSCCSIDDVADARSVATGLGMPYYVFNFADRFERDVIDRFVDAYVNGRTPNPCIDCNRYLKFDQLFVRAQELGCDYVVTGHYAQISYDEAKGRYLLRKAVDPLKDQSYVLYSLTQEQLAHAMFPLGGLHKTQVREIAEKHGFVNAQKHDSQDICFIQTGTYADFIEARLGRKFKPGNFVDEAGNVLGRHKGIIHYTVGQRKGLGIAFGKPMFVTKIDPISNTVTLGENGSQYASSLIADKVNLISADTLKAPISAQVKVRYQAPPASAQLTPLGNGKIRVDFQEPQRSVTPGQAAVFYDGDLVLGGGIIETV